MKEGTLTTVIFFRFNTAAGRWWAFKQMRQMPPRLNKMPGLYFHKMLGSGGGSGFSSWPDWGSYALLGVWRAESDYQSFLNSPLYREFSVHSCEHFRVQLRAFRGRGSWNGRNPFTGQKGEGDSEFMAVITRASIRRRELWQFWRFVPGVSAHLFQRPGLIFAKGIGEWPLVEQATFSLWRSAEAMEGFAYHNPAHSRVIKKTRELQWYREEMFMRFEVLDIQGSWQGRDLVYSI